MLQTCHFQVTSAGGRGIAAYCNHAEPAEIRALFERVDREQAGRLDILVNNAYAAVQWIGKNVSKTFYDATIAEPPEQAWEIVNNVKNFCLVFCCSYF